MFSVCCLKVPKNPDLGADAERVRKEEQGKIDESEHISEEEIAEKEGLLKKVRQIVSFLCLHVRILLYKVLYTLVYLCHSFFFFNIVGREAVSCYKLMSLPFSQPSLLCDSLDL